MNVTASKLLLAFSLAAYTYCSWDALFPDPPPAPPTPAKTRELTAAMVNPRVVLNLPRDPFDSVPLDRGVASSAALVASEPAKVLGSLNLQGILVSPFGRTAMINGKSLHEGQTIALGPEQPSICAKRIGVDYVVVEAAGAGLAMLRLDEPGASNPHPAGALAQSNATAGNHTATAARPGRDIARAIRGGGGAGSMASISADR